MKFEITNKFGDYTMDTDGDCYNRSSSTIVEARDAVEALESVGYRVGNRVHVAGRCVRASALTRGVTAKVWG